MEWLRQRYPQLHRQWTQSIHSRRFGYYPIHDANGNLTGDGIAFTFTYDAANRLTSANRSDISLSGTFTYDPAGRLRKSIIGTNATELLYDGVNLIAELLVSV